MFPSPTPPSTSTEPAIYLAPFFFHMNFTPSSAFSCTGMVEQYGT
jgi:hypothetical protein